MYRKFIPYIILALTLIISGCSKPGSEYLGKWQDTKNDSETMEIVANGESFLITPNISGKDKIAAIPALLEQGVLKINMGFNGGTFSYVKSSDTIVASAALAGTAEYRRIK